MTDSAYVPPASGFYMKKPTSPGIWRIFGILIAIVNVAVWFGAGSLDSDGGSGGGTGAYSAGYAAGFAMAGVIWPAIIALLFRIGKSFRNPRSTWKVFFFASLLFLLVGAANVLTKGAQAALDAADPTSLDFLEEVADGANAKLPVMVDEETKLYKVTAAESLLTYHYRMVNYYAEELDSEAFEAAIRDDATKKLCESPETRDPLLKNGVTIRFSYFGTDREPITSFDTTPADCGF